MRGGALPALSRRLLEWAGRQLDAPELAPDAAQLFDIRCRRQGQGAARRWYRRQALATVPLLLRAGAEALARVGAARLSVLDFRLGARMLVRYPGLTVMAVTAMAFAVAVGATTFEFARDVMFPELPLAEGDRIVRLYDLDTRSTHRTGLRPPDFLQLRESTRTLERVGAWQPVGRNLDVGNGRVVPLSGVSLTASAFDVAAARPLLGRLLLPADEAPGAPPVVLLSHRLWQSHLGADPGVVGGTIRLNGVQTTVAGVLPADHVFPEPAAFYVPLQVESLAATGGRGAVVGFGVLAAGVTRAAAAAELSTLGADDREHRSFVVTPFAEPAVTTSGIMTNLAFAITAIFLIMLVVVVCANVALLLYARAATREGELAVRAALGASRGRIIAQLFAEAFVLAGVATAVGLLAAAAALRYAVGLANASPPEALPFWIGDTLSPTTVVWALLLGLGGAAIAGIAPALAVTGRSPAARMQLQAGRSAGLHMRGMWSGIVTTQVALTVILLPVVLAMGAVYWKVSNAERSIAAEQYLSARVALDGPHAATALHELEQRLEAEPWVRGVAIADVVWPAFRRAWPIHVDGVTADAEPAHAQHMSVGVASLEALGARVIAGRALNDGDVGSPNVVVDETFVREVLGGRNAVGRSITIGGREDGADLDAPPAVSQIVGVISDLGLNPYADLPTRAVMYHPLSLEGAASVALTVRTAGTAADFSTRLHVLALQADGLRLHDMRTLDRRMDQPAIEYGAWFGALLVAGGLALLLTLAGIYAVMSFTVARRTREIGVRTALGAAPRKVVSAILGRSVRQVAYGVAAGGVTIPLFLLFMSRVVDPGPDLPLIRTGAVLLLYLALVLCVCLLACVGPLRRALRVQPTEALSANM